MASASPRSAAWSGAEEVRESQGGVRAHSHQDLTGRGQSVRCPAILFRKQAAQPVLTDVLQALGKNGHDCRVLGAGCQLCRAD